MTRTIIFCIKLAIVVVVALWLANHPGRVEIAWLGYQIEAPVGMLVLAIVVIVVIAALIYRFWRFIYRAPGTTGEAFKMSRRKRGYQALTQGMVAVAAGEPEEASRWAKKAETLLEEPPLTMLLSAQAAQLNGDDAAAKCYFTAMLENQETRFLGLRGLLRQAIASGDNGAALTYARQAQALRPRTGWVLSALFDLNAAEGNYAAAAEAVEQAAGYKLLPAPEATRRRAVLALGRALQAREAGNRAEALTRAQEAAKLAPDLAPAIALQGELLIASGKHRKAAKLLERAWESAPHPALARVYGQAFPKDEPLARFKRLATLTARRPDHPESRLAKARAALDARLWGEARRHLGALVEGPLELGNPRIGSAHGPREAVCRLMAELVESEEGDREAGRAWLARAVEAPPDAAWVCTSCGAVATTWAAQCGACGTFDALAWQPPRQVRATLLEPSAHTGSALPAPGPGTTITLPQHGGSAPKGNAPQASTPPPPATAGGEKPPAQAVGAN